MQNRIAEKMEVSYKTVQRLMKRLVDLEMIKQVAMKRIKDINKRNSNKNSNTPEENIKEADFVAHWVPERFVSLVSSFYHESKTIQELWKVVRQCNRVINHGTGDKAFTKDQELTIGLTAIKEFVMKIKAGAKMQKSKFAYFNGIVNNLMDKFYFDGDFMTK